MVDKKQGKKLTFSGKYVEGDQKRKNPRIPVEIQGNFIYMDSENKFTEKCMISSLSTGGISFSTSAVLLKGDVVVITFTLENKAITADCQITRTHGKEVGSRFLNPSEDSVRVIQQYIYKKIFA